MKDKAEGNIESIKWWSLDRLEHPFCRCYSSDAQYYPSWRDTGNGQRFRSGFKGEKKNDQCLVLKVSYPQDKTIFRPGILPPWKDFWNRVRATWNPFADGQASIDGLPYVAEYRLHVHLEASMAIPFYCTCVIKFIVRNCLQRVMGYFSSILTNLKYIVEGSILNNFFI